MSNRHLRSVLSLIRNAAVAAAVSGLVVACGGSKTRSGLGGDTPPPPPKQAGKAGSDAGPAGAKKPPRKISKDARKDYTKAIEYYKKQAATDWSSGACENSADKFLSVASEHPKLVEARYMAGLSYHHCKMSEKAEAQYQQALKVDSSHAPSLSNLGELYFQAGKVKAAKKYWDAALAADSKIVAARNNLAWLMIEKLRVTTDKASWKNLEESARKQLSAALAVDNDNVKTYVLYGLLYLEGSERNKSRLDLAKLLLDEGAKRNDKYAALYNARGLLQMKRNNQSEALKNFNKAVTLDPKFAEARMNVGNITLGFRKYDTAEEQFTEVLKLQPDSYDALIGLGVAKRGLGKLDEAEDNYKKARKLDSKKGASYFNLGVLYKDFRANSANDLKGSQDAYKKALGYFEDYRGKPDATKDGKQEAKDNIADCEKIIKQLDEVMKAMAQSAAEQNGGGENGGGGAK